MVMGGFSAIKGVIPAVALCGISFAGTQFFVSNYIGPQLTDILSALAAIGSLVLLFKVWKPSDTFTMADAGVSQTPKKHGGGAVVLAWSPYLWLVFFVLLWGLSANATMKAALPAFIGGMLDSLNGFLANFTVKFGWPGLHNMVERIPPVVGKAGPYAAEFTFNFLAASGTACLLASVASAVTLGVSPARYFGILAATWKQLFLSMVTIASVLGLAFLMNYCGATATLGLAFAATGVLFPFFSAMLGWLGVFLTGSDTSANALFGNLQVVTATRLNLDPILMAASNSSGGVMGKMISLQSIAVAAAATEMPPSDEAKLFRFTMRHSVLLASLLGVITMIYAYAK
jgi:lactate permease